MNQKHFIRQKLPVFIIVVFIILGFISFGSKLYVKVQELHNQHKILQTLDFLEKHPKTDSEPALEQLLALKFLTVKQKADIYYKLSSDYFTANKIDKFLDIIGEAIFYNKTAGFIEHAVYQYALLAQYYLEIGADSSAYEIILNGRRYINFYKIKDPVIRSQALHAYARYLLSENDFEDALKAQSQMEEDAALIYNENKEQGIIFTKRALALKAYIFMMQGKTEESFTLSEEIYKKYYSPYEPTNHIIAYDFLLPLFWTRTQYAIRTKQYEKAIAYSKEYRDVAKKYNFIMKSTSILKELMFMLPESMKEEWNTLYDQFSQENNILAQTFIENYTQLTGSRLSNTIDNLKYEQDMILSSKRVRESVFIFIFICLAFLLVFYVVYSETQIDGLTKLRNRRALNNRLGRLASVGKSYSAIMIDIDDFKKLNDTFGHDFGDEVLRCVAGLLVRAETKDIKCYRYGGEEMVVLLEHFDLEHSVRFAENIRNEISLLKWQKDVHVTASFGVGYEMSDSLKEADENMYVAKQKGKNFTAYKKDGTQYLAERRLDIRSPIPDKN